MKKKSFFASMAAISMLMSFATQVSVQATTSELNETYAVTDPESSVPAIADNALTLTTQSRSGITVTGMTQSTVYDEEKGRNVMQLKFNEKNNSSNTDVCATLDGLAALLADGSANTISFDYKVTGSTDGQIGMFFVGTQTTDFSDYQTKYPAIGLRNGGGIVAFARMTGNRNGWYNYVSGTGWLSHDSDNKQWNRLTLAVDDTGKKITSVYINGQSTRLVTNSDGNIANGTTAMGEIDKILFNANGNVTAASNLAILFDNIKVYQGAPMLADATGVTSELTLINDPNASFANMTDGYVMDPVKGMVRQLSFNAKAENTNVRAGLSGLSTYMTDDVNTICFDYKLSGSSTNHVGLFLNDTIGASYWSETNVAMLLNNSRGIQLRARPNYNGSDYDEYADMAIRQQANPINREWNRAVLEINNVTGEVKGYVNGKYYGSAKDASTSPASLDTLFFNTKPAVKANDDGNYYNSLSILLDDIHVYPGRAKAADVDCLEIVDAAGNEIDGFDEDDAVYIKTAVKNDTNSAADYLAVLAAYNENGRMIGYAVNEIKNIQPGCRGYTDETASGLTVPIGTATVKAFVWSSDSYTPVYDVKAVDE